MFHIERKLNVLACHFRLLLQDRRANFAIITALLMPIFLFTFGLLFEGGRALAYYSQSKRVIAQACERSTKPTRTNVPLDEVRRKNVLDTFDALISSTKQQVVSRDATIDWLTTDIKAEFTYRTMLGSLFNVEKIDYKLAYRCGGIPPYPYDGEVIVNNTFDRLNGVERVLKYGKSARTPKGCWGVYTYAEIGWDGGTGPGIELQDWSNAECRARHNWQGYDVESGKLTGQNARIPPTKYVVELDSDWEGRGGRDANSSIFKYVELHPGTYEVSVWYNGRNDAYGGTNDVDISLQVLRPKLGSEKKIIAMAQKDKVYWERRSYSITVDIYSLYKLTIAAGGKSDSLGGIITAFEVTYVDSPK
nr:pilus assembly protein [Rhizobium sp. NFACC06-2]